MIKKISEKKHGNTVNILTHCNAGWLAFVDYGSALAPIYAAFDAGIDIHVWVDETRPRNQGAGITAWELSQYGISHDLVCDNAGGYLMQQGMVDLVLTGADRVARNGDAANKIGTYLKALAAKENNVPFYAVLPSTSFDIKMRDGVKGVPIEERDASEVRFVSGKNSEGKIEAVQICPDATPARNWGFDVTPAKFITGLITEEGICEASEKGIFGLYPEYLELEHILEDAGYVKYTAEHTTAPAVEVPQWEELNNARNMLFKLGLVGIIKGIGYGNLSIRSKDNEFFITGNATGSKETLGLSDYCIVTLCDIELNFVASSGPIQASSEAMTHGAIYCANSEVNCVIHIHSRQIFDGMIRDNYPSTPQSAAYGSPELAFEIGRCVEKPGAEGKIVMKGHDEGIVVYAGTIQRALDMVMELQNKYGV
jgi:translation initiation factor 2B subunit (eIF-2B alpha/beta/delta family)